MYRLTALPVGVGSRNSVPAQLKRAPSSRDAESQGRETPVLPLLYFVDTMYANKQIFFITTIFSYSQLTVCISKMLKHMYWR